CRIGTDRTGPRRPPAPLHATAAVGRAGSPRGNRAGRRRRRGRAAEGHQPAAGVPVPAALPARRRAVRGRGPATRRAPARSLRRVSRRGRGSPWSEAVKIAVIGGGSTYTPELIEGFARRADVLGFDELVLHDISADRLSVVGGLAERILARDALADRLRTTTSLDDAVDGAAAVLVQLRVGGQQARLTDETVPGKFGLLGQETTGPGGFAKALRTVPVVLDIASVVAKRAQPDAWIVDFTNPVGIVTRALLDEGHRALGLCNVAIGFQRRLAARFGVG